MWVTFLMKNWKLIVIGLAVAAIYFYWNNLTSTIEEQAQQLVELKAENKTLKASIQTQNDAVDKLAEEKRLKDIQLRLAEEKSKQTRKEADAAVQKILQGIKPETCSAAIQYLIKSVETGDLKL